MTCGNAAPRRTDPTERGGSLASEFSTGIVPFRSGLPGRRTTRGFDNHRAPGCRSLTIEPPDPGGSSRFAARPQDPGRFDAPKTHAPPGPMDTTARAAVEVRPCADHACRGPDRPREAQPSADDRGHLPRADRRRARTAHLDHQARDEAPRDNLAPEVCPKFGPRRVRGHTGRPRLASVRIAQPVRVGRSANESERRSRRALFEAHDAAERYAGCGTPAHPIERSRSQAAAMWSAVNIRALRRFHDWTRFTTQSKSSGSAQSCVIVQWTVARSSMP